jgi:hypothetical protein
VESILLLQSSGLKCGASGTDSHLGYKETGHVTQGKGMMKVILSGQWERKSNKETF